MTNTATADSPECWPALPLDSWRETCATLHMWTQIVGKVRMRLTPAGESLVERASLCERARADHLEHSLRRAVDRNLISTFSTSRLVLECSEDW